MSVDEVRGWFEIWSAAEKSAFTQFPTFEYKK